MSIYSEIKPEVRMFADMCVENSRIDPELYLKYDVKRGLRDLNGKGVLTGLTNISEIISSKTVDGKSVPCEGELYYRGYSVEELVRRQLAGDHFGYERTAYLLLFGELPDEEHFKTFCELLSFYRTLPTSFVRDIIMKAPSSDMMNTLARSVLTLYSYDEDAEDISIPNVLRQSMQLIALFPLLSVYGYQAYRHYHDGQSLFIHQPDPKLSTAENILRILRPDCSYTELEARVLDIALILHADHGGGNNSTFTTHVVTSSGTDTYSAIAAALGSLKGPKHGGANIKVVKMFEDIKEHVKDWNDDEELTAYLRKLLHKEAFDKAGLIYGMGHAVYSLSDPRANILRGFVETLSREKGRTDEYELYSRVERLAPQVIADERLTRLLGLIPILLGIRSWRQTQSDDAPSPSRATLGTSGIFLLTVANGADNVGVYIPAFSRSSPLQLGVTFLLFALLCLVWWLLAERFAAYPLLQRKLQQYQHILVPLVLIAIGLSVLLG